MVATEAPPLRYLNAADVIAAMPDLDERLAALAAHKAKQTDKS